MGDAAHRSNAELVREGFGAFSEGRFEDSLEALHPDIEWHVAFRLPDLPSASGVIHGRAAVLELWGHFSSVWDRLVFDPEETLYDQGDTMIVRTHVQATGGGSGVELDQTLYYALTIRDGLLSRIVPNFSLEEAAKEAGIDPGELPRRA